MQVLLSQLANTFKSLRRSRPITLVVLLMASLVGCETELVTFKGPYHVRFTNVTLTEKESNSNIIQIEVHNAGPAIADEVSIRYTISGDARENIDYTILGTRGVVTIPDGEYFGYIEIQLLNNANNIIRSQDLILTLTRADNNLRVGQSEGGIGKVCTLTIEDDCLLSGSYTGKQGTSSNTISAISISSDDCESYLISNWDINNLMGSADPVPLVFIDHGDNTITIKPQTQSIFYGFGDQEVVVSGLGSVNPTTKVIFMSLNFTYTDINGDVRTKASTLTFTPE
jgi:hypothetical protein